MSANGESYLLELLAGCTAAGAALQHVIAKVLNRKVDDSSVHEAEISGAVKVTEVATQLVKALEGRVNSLTERVTHLETINTKLRSEHSILSELYEELQSEYKEILEENIKLNNKVDSLKNR